MKIYLAMLTLLLIISSVAFAFCYNQQNIPDNKRGNINSTVISYPTVSTVIPTNRSEDSNLFIPTDEQIISAVNWSDYHLVRFNSISKATITGPNSIINHTFIDIHIRADVLDPDDVLGIYKEMSSIVKKEKEIVGPNSSIEIFCYTEHGTIFNAWMLPYSNIISRRDYVHPIHNLTFSDIDASEVD